MIRSEGKPGQGVVIRYAGTKPPEAHAGRQDSHSEAISFCLLSALKAFLGVFIPPALIFKEVTQSNRLHSAVSVPLDSL